MQAHTTYYYLHFTSAFQFLKPPKIDPPKPFVLFFKSRRKCTHTYTYKDDFSTNSNFISLNVGGGRKPLLEKEIQLVSPYFSSKCITIESSTRHTFFFNQKNIFLKINRKHQLNDCSLVMQVWRLHGWMCKYF